MRKHTDDMTFVWIVEKACVLRDGRDRVTKTYRRLCKIIREQERQIKALKAREAGR